MPSSRHARSTRTAISPRLATSSFLIFTRAVSSQAVHDTASLAEGLHRGSTRTLPRPQPEALDLARGRLRQVVGEGERRRRAMSARAPPYALRQRRGETGGRSPARLE